MKTVDESNAISKVQERRSENTQPLTEVFVDDERVVALSTAIARGFVEYSPKGRKWGTVHRT